MLNLSLDVDALAAQYRADQRIRIENVLLEAVAERVRTICSGKTPYEFAYFQDGGCRSTSASEMAAFDDSTKSRLARELMQNAARGVGFLYCRYLVRHEAQVDDPDLAFLHEVAGFLNSPPMLEFIARVTGRADVSRADAQYTRYSSGQYLTRHRDIFDDQSRRIAYVFGFTRAWHPDWGGLLQFFEDSGEPRDAWAPAFNRLSLFDVRHVHSVTFVTPFAGGDRYSLTGWFYAD
ncbi:MAG TPA: 2OG-Fe(II) oxygenase family protein [Woeseiaceae bacterium]